MNKTVINDIEYKIHPIYDLYGADKNGDIINIVKKVSWKGTKRKNDYLMCCVRKYQQKSQKALHAHRFVWECLNS